MRILTDFFSSDAWQDINNRVFATFGLSGLGTVANAIPETTITEVVQTNFLFQLVQVLTAVSYITSILVALTVLYRFSLWYKEKKIK